MSASINGNVISLTRGDTLRLYVNIFCDDGTEYELNDGDIMRFAMKKKITDSNCIILKTIPSDTHILFIEPSDTKQLNIGQYVYDIELTTEDGDVDTFIGPAIFKLTEEVY